VSVTPSAEDPPHSPPSGASADAPGGVSAGAPGGVSADAPGGTPRDAPPVVPHAGLHRWLPITAWAGGYHRRWLRADTIAGLTVIGLLLPECMAYAQIAGVPPQAGLYATLAGLTIYALFGTSRQLICSPTSTAAIMAAAVVAAHGATSPTKDLALVAMVAVLVGLFMLIAGIARLGFISEFLARPVITGYVIGLALTIIARQVPKLLGLRVPTSANFFQLVWTDLTHLDETSLATALVSAVALVSLFAVRRWSRIPAALTVLVLGIVVAAAFHLGAHGVTMVGTIPSGLPVPRLPDIRAADVLGLLPSAAGIAIVVYAEALSGARTFAVRHSYEIDANQELVALGLSNIGSGAFGGIVVSGGLSGSALSDTSGARSQVTGLIGAAVMLLVVLSVTRVGHNLPEAILGAVVVRAVWGLIDVKVLRRFASVRAGDAVPALAALLGVLVLGVLPGLGIAVGLSLAILIYRSSRPHTAVLGRVPSEHTYSDMGRHPQNETFPGLLIFRLDGQLFFANAGFAVDRLNQLLSVTQPTPRVVVWNMESTTDLDVTAAETLLRLVHNLRDSGRDVVFARVGSSVLDVFRRSGLLELLGEDHLFLTVDSAVQDCLHSRLAVVVTLEAQLAEVAAACRLARSVAKGKIVSGEAHQRIAQIEHRGDTMRAELVTRLSGVLVAPIDREDLFRLSRSIDDVLDNLRDFVREWDLYDIEATNAYIGLLDATASGVDDLQLAVQAIAKDPTDLRTVLASKKFANEIRRQYDVELGRLFRGKLTMEVMKSRELLRRLDVVGLRLNEAADRLSDAAIKRWS
jgi:high affinity sulfate transporter 1